jgi:hypothetical protein
MICVGKELKNMIWVDNIIMDGGIDWNDLAQDTNQWRALMNRTLNLWIPQNAQLAASQEGIS